MLTGSSHILVILICVRISDVNIVVIYIIVVIVIIIIVVVHIIYITDYGIDQRYEECKIPER